MKHLATIFIAIWFIYSGKSFSSDYKHMISFGTQGLGWSGAVEKMESKSESNFSSVDYLLSNISLNYAYLIGRRFQLGAFYKTYHQEHEFHPRSKDGEPNKIEVNTIGLFVLYNFSDALNSAFYTGFSFSSSNYEEENSTQLEDSEGKAPFELDDTGHIYEIVFGKRFRLLKWNIDHLTYSPQIGIFQRTHGKDFNDQDINNGKGITFQPIKFDFLF